MADEHTQKSVSRRGQFLLGVYLAVITAGLSYFTAKLWPPVAPPAGPSTQAPGPGAKAGVGNAPATPSAENTAIAPNPPKVPNDATGGKAGESKGETAPGQKTPQNKDKEATKPEDKSSPAESKAGPGDAGGHDQQEQRRSVRLFLGMIEFSMTADIRLILLVLAVGALGGCVHAATSFVGFVGNDRLYTSWIWYYLLRMPISAALALITYFVVRAGFFTTASGSTATVNDFGIAAVSGLVGMFSKQATAKLDEVFTALFRTEKHEELGDKLANKIPTLTAVNPAVIAHGSADTSITVRGDGFVDKSEVRWAGDKLATTFGSATQLTASVPAAKLATAGFFDVTVFTPAPGGGRSPSVRVTVS